MKFTTARVSNFWHTVLAEFKVHEVQWGDAKEMLPKSRVTSVTILQVVSVGPPTTVL